jgi:hypothetical protein
MGSGGRMNKAANKQSAFGQESVPPIPCGKPTEKQVKKEYHEQEIQIQILR